MKESYADDIMLCYVQGFGNSGGKRGYKDDEYTENDVTNNNVRASRKKHSIRKLLMDVETIPDDSELELKPKKTTELVTGKSLKLSSGDGFLKKLPEVKRSFSDRFSIVNADVNGKRPKGFLTLRKTWSTGNFASGAGGAGCGGPRSAPATPLQLEPHPRPMKHEKQAVKPLSRSVPSVQALPAGQAPGGGVSDASEGKAPSKARQKKFFRHFPQVGPDERVLNYYSCALVGDILLQGHLYITKNYFAFYSNVFGYVTKLLIPTPSVLRVTKEKMARIIPNAVGVCTRDERHVFGSLLSRDSTYKLMTHVWKAARTELPVPPPPQAQPVSETEPDASEYSVEDETSSAGGDDAPQTPKRREPDAIITGPGAAVIQPGLLTGTKVEVTPRHSLTRMFLLVCSALLFVSALCLAHCVYRDHRDQGEVTNLSGSELYSELVRWRARLHGRAATELQAFLSTNLLLLTKVRQSLETLSGVILSDMAQATGNPLHLEVPPNDTTFS